MTKDEFERRYAERSGMSVEELRAIGLWAEECSCDYEECKGWAMQSQDNDAFLAQDVPKGADK